MAELGQGLVLLVTGMGIVYLFLGVLILVTNVACKALAPYDSIFPKDAPKKTPAKVASNDDENIAVAIAVAMKGI